jgi:hypothetical protein
MDDDRWFERLADPTDLDSEEPRRAPARLKARVYSALIQQMAASGPLLSLIETRAEGHKLCVFETTVVAFPAGERLKSANPCRVCHARILAERMEHAPIFWPACPYSKFHRS